MTSSLFVGIALVVLALSFAALLSAAETAITRIGVARAESLASDDLAGSRALVVLLKDRQATLGQLLLLRVTAEIVAVSTVVIMANNRGGVGVVVLTIVATVVLILLFIETTPRAWALRNSDSSARRAALSLRRILRFAPLRWLTGMFNRVAAMVLRPSSLPEVSEGELIALAEVAAAGDAIDDRERGLIESVFALGDTIVREVMVPRTDMTTVNAGASVCEVIDLASELGFSRMPVCGDGIDDIIGVSLLKDLTGYERSGRGTDPVRLCMRPPSFVPETKHAGDLLGEMQAGRQHLAIVIDEYGGTAGLVTLEDLVEELVGEIVDEFDSFEPLFEPLAGGELLVHGRMPVDQVNILLGVELDDGDWDTIGGLIFNTLGHVPEVGESVENGSLHFRVERLEGRRITRVRLSPVASATHDG